MIDLAHKLVSLAFLGVALCPINVSSEPKPGPIKIGVIQSLTGIAAEYGKNVMHGLSLAVEDINEKAGNESERVELIVEDDQTDSKRTVAAFQKLARSNVDAVIGATWDFTTNAIVPLSAQRKLVLFSTSSVNQAINLKEGVGYAFNNGLLVEEETRPFDRYLRMNPVKRVTLVFANNAWGEMLRDSHAAVARTNGAEIVDEIRPAGFEANDWSSIIPRLKSKNPDLLVLLVNKSDLELIARRTRELQYSAKMYSSVAGFDAFYASSDKSLFDGMCFAYPTEALASSASFVEKHRARFKEEPRRYSDTSYDALWMLVNAVTISRRNGTNLRETLTNQTWSGLGTSYRFSPDKSFSSGYSSLVCIKGDRAEVVIQPK